MKPLLRAELIKLATTRTFAGLAGAAIGISLLITILVGILTDPTTKDDVRVDIFNSDMSGLFIFMLAVIGITGEWRHRTITSSLLAAPDRLRFLFAKLLAFAAAGAVLSVLISVSVTVAGLIIVAARDLPMPDAGVLIGQIGRNALISLFVGALGVGLGALVRNQVVAVVGVLVLGFLVEPTVTALVPEVGRFGPFTALPTSLAGIPAEDAGIGDVDLLAPGLAGLAMLAWIAATFSAGYALLRERDVH
jgi:ABC-2 type transport system permease protein